MSNAPSPMSAPAEQRRRRRRWDELGALLMTCVGGSSSWRLEEIGGESQLSLD